MSRRTFIQHTAVLGGCSVISPMFGYATGSRENADPLPWYRKPLRILQTVLREPDAAGYDAAAVVRYMQETSANTLVVNAGGIVDFFQNPLPAANINTFMGKGDVLRDITTACRAAGIRVIGRVDFRGVEEHIFKKFPSWFSVDADGAPLQLSYTRPQLYASCYTGTYRNDHAEEFIRHLMSAYSLDGIWHNSIGVGGICYCGSCRQSFREATGKPIPPGSAGDVALGEYMEWKTSVADRHMERMKKTVKSFGNDKVYTAEVFSMFETGSLVNSGIDLYNARDHFDFLVSVAFLTENSEHIRYEDLTYANTIVRFLKSLAPEKEAIILYGENGTAHRYVRDPATDLNVWLWQALAAGGHFWNCSFTGPYPAATYDRRNARNQVAAYQFVRDNSAALAQQIPVANVGVYYSRHTRHSYRTPVADEGSFDLAIRGVVNVLAEHHIPYDFIPDDQASPSRLNKYQLIVLPNVRCMGDAEIDLLREFVRKGGRLLATFETSLFRQDGSPRKNYGLADVFGCDFTGEMVNTRKDCYQFIVDKSHPVVRDDADETSLLINAGFTLLNTPATTAHTICTYVPVVHNQPPEKAWTTEWAGKFPTVTENGFGQGKVIYFSNQPDRISYELGHPDARNLLARAVRYLVGDAALVTTDAPESVHIGLTRSLETPQSYLLSLVNTTAAPVRPLRRIVPVENIRISIPIKAKVDRYQVLKSSGSCRVESQDDLLVVQVSRLEDFFALHFVLTG